MLAIESLHTAWSPFQCIRNLSVFEAIFSGRVETLVAAQVICLLALVGVIVMLWFDVHGVFVRGTPSAPTLLLPSPCIRIFSSSASGPQDSYLPR